MTVTQKSGKDEITVHGSPEQIDQALVAWLERIQFTEPYQRQCALIRNAAVRIGLENTADAKVEDLLKIMLARLQ
jgi:hypothetical protein